MIDTSQIVSRCARLGYTLDARAHDEVTLLRTARALKVVHSHLKQAAWTCTRAEGHTPRTVRVEAALDAMEQDLRKVLIDYASLRKPQLHSYLVHALNQSRETLTLLEA